MTEDDFLRALRDNPNDDAVRLVYADWLEERGDTRAEYLRLQHQLDQIPKRLEELHGQIDPQWLKQVSRRYQVVLQFVPPESHFAVVNAVREVTGLGVRETQILLNALPFALRHSLSRQQAEKLANSFQQIATVTIEPWLVK